MVPFVDLIMIYTYISIYIYLISYWPLIFPPPPRFSIDQSLTGNLKMDPLKTTEKEMMGGYKFVHRPPNKVKKATSRKRASAPKTAQDKKSQTAEKRKVPAKVSSPNGGSKGAAKRKAENKEVTSDRVERKTRLEPFAAENMANKTPSLRPAVPQQFVQANVQPRVFSPKVPQTPGMLQFRNRLRPPLSSLSLRLNSQLSRGRFPHRVRYRCQAINIK